MSINKSLPNFTARNSSIGPVLWVCCIQYYIVQVIVALQWSHSYSLSQNTISDLGNTVCGLYGSRQVCSPINGLMNFSFILLGILMIAGAVLVYPKFQKSLITFSAFLFIAIGGFGALLVGVFPENTVSQLHISGAALSFIIGNIGLVCFGFVPGIPKNLRLFAIISGITALVALIFFSTHSYLGLGIGGMERITAYPQSIWLILLGSYLFKVRE